MSDSVYRRGSRERDPDRRLTVRPDGTPAPTGYYPDRSNPGPGRVVETGVHDGLYGPARAEHCGAELVDQHAWLQVSACWQPPQQGPRRDGRDDPLADGLPAPTPRLLAGIHHYRGPGPTRMQDVPGLRYPPHGSQDGATWVYYQDAARAMAPYSPPVGETEMPDSLRALPPSPAHGWTEQPITTPQEENNLKTARISRMRPPVQDRLAGSTYAGQSYSAQTAHAGAGAATGSTPTWRSRG